MFEEFKHTANQIGYIQYLDGWRGLAIVFVLLGHFLLLAEFDLFVGRFGVDVFFALSGLLMSNILFVKKVPLQVFYKRRISRILPVFLIYCFLVYLIDVVFFKTGEIKNLWYTIVFLRSYFPEGTNLWEAPISIDHLWSLNIEEHCYVVLSVVTILGFLRRFEHLALFFLGFLSVAIHYYYVKTPDAAPINIQLRTEVAATPLLVSAAYFLICNKVAVFVKGWMVLAAFFLAFICYTPLTPHWTGSWTLTPFLLAFAVNHLNALNITLLNFLKSKILTKIGVWSYSIYLWQQPLYHFCKELHQPLFFQCLIGMLLMLLAVAIGFVSYRYIELPIRIWINKYW